MKFGDLSNQSNLRMRPDDKASWPMAPWDVPVGWWILLAIFSSFMLIVGVFLASVSDRPSDFASAAEASLVFRSPYPPEEVMRELAVPLESFGNLTFRPSRNTKPNRHSASRPEMDCAANQSWYSEELIEVRCVKESRWLCTTDSPRIRVGGLAIECDGYAYSNRSRVIPGSCSIRCVRATTLLSPRKMGKAFMFIAVIIPFSILAAFGH